MCGRFVAVRPVADLVDYFAVDEVRLEELVPSWNVAPTDTVAAVAEHGGRRAIGTFAWGFVAGKGRHINARAETVDQRPAFRDALQRRRCLIPADGFYEWERLPDGTKQPYFISRADGTPFAFAGLWSADDPVRTCTIVTTAANEEVAPLHDRMPVSLAPDRWGSWLDRSISDTDAATALLQPDGVPMTLRPVSRRVNDVRNNDAALLADHSVGVDN